MKCNVMRVAPRVRPPTPVPPLLSTSQPLRRGLADIACHVIDTHSEPVLSTLQ